MVLERRRYSRSVASLPPKNNFRRERSDDRKYVCGQPSPFISPSKILYKPLMSGGLCLSIWFILSFTSRNLLLHYLETLDAVSRQLTDEFSIQEIAQQQIHCSRFRAIKASLHKCMKDGAGQAVDCYVRQLLVAIATTFRSLLRSSHGAADQFASKFFFCWYIEWRYFPAF